MDYPPCRVVPWSEIDRWSDLLAEKIRAAHHEPEVIVGLTRGGWVPSRMLADRLGTKHLAALRAQHWGVTATPSGKAEITEGLNGRLDGKKVLVVDDITDTGQSLQLAVRHVAERGPVQVESATYLHISHSTYVPTYYAEEVPRESWRWFVFPWNYWEDLRTLARTARGEPETPLRVVLEGRTPIDPSARVLAGGVHRTDLGPYVYEPTILDGVGEQTLEQLGKELGVTKERVRQLEARAQNKLRKIATEERLEAAIS